MADTQDMFVIVEHCDPHRSYPGPRVYDVRPDDSLPDVQERAERMSQIAAESGRPEDTYAVYQLVPVDLVEEKPNG